MTSATLNWSVPVDYESIARYGGLWYTVHTQNMDTGREETLTCSDTTITHSLVHSTEYCFRVRAEVSGGAGVYSERQCYTTPGMTVVNECNKRVLNITVWYLNCTPAAESQGVPVDSIAAPSAGILVLLLLVVVTCGCCLVHLEVRLHITEHTANSLHIIQHTSYHSLNILRLYKLAHLHQYAT